MAICCLSQVPGRVVVAPRRGYWARAGASRPRERGATGLPQQLVDLGGEGEFAELREPVEEFGREGMEPVGADPPAGLPEDLCGGGDLVPVAARAPGARCSPPRLGLAAEQSDGRLAVNAGHGHDLVQELLLLGSRRPQVALPLDGRVLPKAGSGHGSLLSGIGNRDF